jgi:sugar-specific transcriptional regulator TrmB
MEESVNLSLELVIDTLVSFGLKRIEAEVYAFLAKKGPQRGKELVKALKITKQQLYPALKNLVKKGIVKSTSNRPALFSAEPVEKVLTMFMESRTKEIHTIIQKKDELLSRWKTIIIEETAKK